MKYYEVRSNPENTKIYIMEKIAYHKEKGRLLYDGDFDILKYCKKVDDNLYSVEFKSMCNGITSKKLKKAGFNEKLNSNFNWVLNDSDHRKDVRVVDENYYNKLINGETNKQIVKNCEHLSSKHKYSFDTIEILATTAIHQLGDISRETPDVAYVSESDDENYYGYWKTGYGYIDVRFPKSTSEIIEGI